MSAVFALDVFRAAAAASAAMSVHAARAALRAAAHEAHVPRAAAAARARHQPRGRRRARAARADAHDRPERAPSAAAAHPADTSLEHLSDGCGRCGAAPALPAVWCPTPSFLLRIDAESAEPYAVPGLQEESLVGDLLGRHVRRIAESDHGDPVDRLVVGHDSPYTHPGVDGEAGGPTSYHNAIGEEYASPKTDTTNSDCPCRPSAYRELGRAAAAALVC